mmetsp:Transcript_3750/g.6392  ORF Transcript_3750/g.6392 Transcript_3750/m.6392 type:complete len:257 (-) Transcript_3750:1008-1778(-)
MVGDAASVEENCLSGSVLDVLVNVDHLAHVHVLVVHGEVDVDSGASLVELGDSEADEHVSLLHAIDLAGIEYPLSHILAQRFHFGPGARGLEALCHHVVLEAQVPDVGDHVGQLVAFDSIFGSSREAPVLRGDIEHLLHLERDDVLGTFEEAGGRHHLIRVESLHPNHVLLLDLVDDVLGAAGLGRLERLAELELDVVDQSQGRGVKLLLGHLLHELSALVEVGENDRAELLHLGDGPHSHNRLGDDAEVSLVADD